MTIQNLRWSYILLVNSLEVVRFPIKLGDYFDDVTTILGLLTVEGDEHKHQVRFLYRDFKFLNYCLIKQVAQDLGQLCWSTGVLNV